MAKFGMVPETVAMDDGLGRMALRVMILLCARMDAKTRSVSPERASTKAISEALGVHSQNVKRAKIELRKRGHISYDGPMGQRPSVFIFETRQIVTGSETTTGTNTTTGSGTATGATGSETTTGSRFTRSTGTNTTTRSQYKEIHTSYPPHTPQGGKVDFRSVWDEMVKYANSHGVDRIVTLEAKNLFSIGAGAGFKLSQAIVQRGDRRLKYAVLAYKAMVESRERQYRSSKPMAIAQSLLDLSGECPPDWKPPESIGFTAPSGDISKLYKRRALLIHRQKKGEDVGAELSSLDETLTKYRKGWDAKEAHA